MMTDTQKKTSEDQQPNIIWDDSNMRSVYSNVTNVSGGREEIILLFGMNQAWQATQTDVKVQLTERMVLSPYAAKRLSILLSKTMAEYEKRFGVLNIGGMPENIA